MKKKNMKLRIIYALIFLGFSGLVMFSIYSFSAESGEVSNLRSETVTEKIKEEVKNTLETTPKGLLLSEKIKYYIILHSPYGSNWNANIRKFAHFSIYFCLATMVYITLTILGVNKFTRFILTVGFCFCFAFGDEYHQKLTANRTSSMNDVYLDTFGSFVATSIWTIVSIMYSGVAWIVRQIQEAYKS